MLVQTEHGDQDAVMLMMDSFLKIEMYSFHLKSFSASDFPNGEDA